MLLDNLNSICHKHNRHVSVINTIDTGHGDMIHDAQMDYAGSMVATCSSDHMIKIFSAGAQQNLIAELKGFVQIQTFAPLIP